MQRRNIAEIKANPKNPRVIKDDKFNKLVQSIKEFPEMLEKRPLVCFTDTDGKFVVLGGNMRLKAAKEVGLKELPILLADDWTEEQKAQFLIKDNVGFGEWNWDELQQDWDTEKLEEWGLDMPDFRNSVFNEDELDIFEEENNNAVLSLNDNAFFSTNLGAMGIPRIDPSMCAEIEIGKNISTWVGKNEIDVDYFLLVPSSNKPPEGELSNFILCFYTDDSRFERYYTSPSKYVSWLKNRCIDTVIMPNFSMYKEYSEIQRLFNLYKSRWLARFFQASGIKVIPDIQLNTLDYGFVIDGIPKGIDIVSVQFHTSKKDVEFYKKKLEELKRMVDDIQPKKVLIYSDNKSKEDIAHLNLNSIIIFVDSFMTKKRIK